MWEDIRLYHILEGNTEPGEPAKVGAALITNAPGAVVEDACVSSRNTGSPVNWFQLESFIHERSFMAVIVKWEVRFL